MKRICLIALALCGLNCGIGHAQTLKLDSLVYTYPNSSKAPNKYAYTYNPEGQAMRETFYVQTNGTWGTAAYTDYTYDLEGNRIREAQSDATGKPIFDKQYSYDASGNRIGESSTTYFQGEPEGKSEYIYDSEGRQTQRIIYKINEAGEFYPYAKYVSGYDDAGRMTSDEGWEWNGTELELQWGNYMTFNAEDSLVYLEEQKRGNTRMEKSIYKIEYDEEGRRNSLENLVDNDSFYKHFIETWSYNADGSGLYEERDTIIDRTDQDKLRVTAYSSDCTYDAEWRLLSKVRYAVNPGNGEREYKINELAYTYDENGNRTSEIYSEYEQDKLTWRTKEERMYGENGISYEARTYDWDLANETWTPHGGSKYDYAQTDSANYEYVYSYLNQESGEWIKSHGHKQTNKGDENNFERFDYDWNADTNNWALNGGRRYLNEVDEEGNAISCYATWDAEEETWIVNNGKKTVVSGENPKVHSVYDAGRLWDEWTLREIASYYYSEIPTTRNESIAPQSTLKVYSGKGSLHIESPKAGNLSVYTLSGRKIYAAHTDGNKDITGLSRGIYLITLQSSQGTDTVKVQVN